jgi:hypothetical protein
MSCEEEPGPGAVFADMTARIRSRQSASRATEALPDSFIARMRECERLARETQYPEMAEIMHKLAGLWRQAARVGSEYIGESGGGQA